MDEEDSDEDRARRKGGKGGGSSKPGTGAPPLLDAEEVDASPYPMDYYARGGGPWTNYAHARPAGKPARGAASILCTTGVSQ